MAVKVSNLKVYYEDTLALDNVNLHIPKGSFAAIVGPNGAGKSSLLKAKLNLIPYDGEIKFFDEDLSKSRNKISYMPQIFEVDWSFPVSVLEVVLMGLIPFKRFYQGFNDIDRSKAIDALKFVGMDKFKDVQINELSGGQKQKVFLARSLVSNCDILVLDEPVAGVDISSTRDIFNVLKKLHQAGKTIIVVYHDLNSIEKYFDFLVVVNKTVIDHGPIKDVLNRDSISKAFSL